jgi:hypothetical protein
MPGGRLTSQGKGLDPVGSQWRRGFAGCIAMEPRVVLVDLSLEHVYFCPWADPSASLGGPLPLLNFQQQAYVLNFHH